MALYPCGIYLPYEIGTMRSCLTYAIADIIAKIVKPPLIDFQLINGW